MIEWLAIVFILGILAGYWWASLKYQSKTVDVELNENTIAYIVANSTWDEAGLRSLMRHKSPGVTITIPVKR